MAGGYHCAANGVSIRRLWVPHVSGLHVGSWWPLMPRNLKRYYGRGDLHFVTFSCYRRLPLLRTIRARNLFVRALGAIRERYKFLLVGYVVMPDHVHLLISEPPKIDTFGNAEGAQAASFPRFAWEKTQSRQLAVTVALHE